METIEANTGAQRLTDHILRLAEFFIPRRWMNERKSTHPWINERILHLVQEKLAAVGPEAELECRKRCSAGIMEEYGKFVMKERSHLQSMPKGAKGWWSRSKRLMQRKCDVSSIPALKGSDDQWVLQAKDKADLLSETFSKKYGLSVEEHNDYTGLANHVGQEQRGLKQLHEKDAETALHNLREDSGTGPDGLPARILKNCAAALARPVLLLSLCILTSGVWPHLWRKHWVAPLYKKNSVYQPGNYRGVHLTAQLSKDVERLLKSLFYPYLLSSSAFGPSQFAYTTGRGARDALALLALTWLSALAAGRKIGVYCSDVSGAFDRVSLERLVAKLQRKGIHPQIVKVLTSWLQDRFAEVVVGGEISVMMVLMNMVYQGTVTGPILWNLFFEDARLAINECVFEEVVYAYDLNAYSIFPSDTDNDIIKTCMCDCQQELHKWGLANQVAFDAGKESQHVLSVSDPFGDSFKMLGVSFDSSLSMADAIEELVAASSWKLRTLIRTRRFYSHADLVVLYEAHLLSFIEYRTPAIYHATRLCLSRIDAIQNRF